MSNITRSAIVTGGAGGIGRVASERLAAAGYRVVVADASSAQAETVASSLPTLNGTHRFVSGDLALPETNRSAVQAALELGTLSVIINAVGISPKNEGHKRPFYDVTPDEWDLVMSVNVKAPLLMTQEAFRHMPSDGSASIVNILSVVARLGAGGLESDSFPPYLPSSIAYAASKGALQNLTASLSRELSSFGIRVNGVAPGFVQTSMTSGVPVTESKKMVDQVPMKRFAQPREIVDAIEYLISDKASYVTGASIDVNGGMLTC